MIQIGKAARSCGTLGRGQSELIYTPEDGVPNEDASGRARSCTPHNLILGAVCAWNTLPLNG
jgi:hypothetical protein